MRRDLVSFAIGLCLSACGGEVGSPVGPPSGTGFYTLEVETLSDDCNPPRISGALGEELVSIGGSPPGVNIAVPSSPSATAPRQDVAFGQAVDVDLAPNGCPKGVLHWSVGPAVRVSADRIDVSATEQWQGVATCPSSTASPPHSTTSAPGLAPSFFEVPKADCQSDRLFHYTWSRPCPAPDAGGPGVHCG